MTITEKSNRREIYLPFGRPSFGDEEVAAVERVLRSGWIGMGKEVAAFEAELATYLHAPAVVSLNSCTSALYLSLLLEGVGPGDEVICPSLTWCSAANITRQLGARVVFCDVDPKTFCATPETVIPKISPRTKAVIPVHFGGLTADVTALRSALPERVTIIEDAAHALGARFADTTPVGGSGNLTAFSFYANKNLSTAEGGALAVFDEEKAERLRVLRQHGLPTDAWQRYINPQANLTAGVPVEVGYKMNYTDLQAALGRVQLRRQDEFAVLRLQIARLYCDELSRRLPEIQHQALLDDPRHARHLFVVVLPATFGHGDRDAFVHRLREDNVGAAIHYAPLHRMAVYDCPDPLPVVDDLAGRLVTLPISASMTLDDARYVMDCVIGNL